MDEQGLFSEVLAALLATQPDEKIQSVEWLGREWTNGRLDRPKKPPTTLLTKSATTKSAPIKIEHPGRPEKPLLVHHRDLDKRKLSTPAGRAALIHAIAHIEFNAINLALDAVYRFREMPEAYYSDWLSVAMDESRHFRLLETRLEELGHQYGDFPAHNGLWDMAVQTDHDVLHRMSQVPCVFEARGLDVTPPMIQKLERVGDEKSASILKVILDEEVGHVAIGQKWFQHECRERGLNPEQTLVDLIAAYLPGRRHGPFNVEDRIKAGFTSRQLTRIGAL